MRRVLACLVSAGLLGAGLSAGMGTAFAQKTGEGAQEASRPAETAKERLDRLFSELKRERNEQAASRIADAIRAEWQRSGSATIDLLMQRAASAMQARKYDAALDFLDEVTVLAPSFAEGWNRRATVHYLKRDYGRSMTDIERTLRLEPRHFGALSGMAAIFKAYDNKQAALNAFERVLDIYPMLRSAQQEVSDLADALAGQGI
ncbi:MAG: hypothetical protein J0H53_18945 [Rhizobiales bacterium]|nr:hypothetical protein [Hyphomicrobiales bacterium]